MTAGISYMLLCVIRILFALRVVIFHTPQTSLRPRPFSRRRCDITIGGKSSLPDVGARRPVRRRRRPAAATI